MLSKAVLWSSSFGDGTHQTQGKGDFSRAEQLRGNKEVGQGECMVL